MCNIKEVLQHRASETIDSSLNKFLFIDILQFLDRNKINQCVLLQFAMNLSSRSSKNLFRERSIGSMASRQVSVMNILNERESVILSEKKRLEQQKTSIIIRDSQISKLRKNLETAVSTALFEKLENTKTKDQIMEAGHHKRYLQNKIKQYEKQLKAEKERYSTSLIKSQELSYSVEELTHRCKEIQQQLQQKSIILDRYKPLPQQIQRLRFQLKDIQPLRQRIITLQSEIRQEKMLRMASQNKMKIHLKQMQALQLQISSAKPRQQQLRQRIAYFQRVNLDLQRKMDDYNRRQNDYIKQITALKFNLARVTTQRNNFKAVYEDTVAKLQRKTAQYDMLVQQHNQKIVIIQGLEIDLEAERKMCLDLKSEIEGNNSFYKKQGQQNILLKQKNELLQSQQYELRRVIEGYLRIADQVNLAIVEKIEQIKKLKQVNENITTQLHNTEQKFDEFDKLVEQGSEKGLSQIRQNFYSLIRANNELTNLVKQQRITFDQKVITFGQQRDNILRNIEVRRIAPPTDETQYLSIFQEKTEALLLYEKSNDQLLKIKKELEAKIEELYRQIEREKKQMNLLKLKTADLFRAKKDLQDARKTIQRYQEMIEQDKHVIDDIKSQVSVLRERNNELNEKNFVIQLEKRNLDIKIKEINEVIKELNVQTLMSHKQTNEKNSHLLMDSLQKLQSAIRSLAFFFNCSFCGELPATPITLALCGHNYCTKCKEAYSESCYECDTGQPIEKAFQNKFLRDAGGKYKFLTMVLLQLRANFNKKA